MIKICSALLVIIFWVVSCEGPRNEIISLNSILKGDSLSNKGKRYFSTGELQIAFDSGRNGIFGNRYEFYKNGNLRLYGFQVDSVHITYALEFDSTGNQNSPNESPLVFRLFSADDTPDSIYIKYYFTRFLNKGIKLSISDDSKRFNQVQLNKDKDLAFIETFEYWKDVRNMNRINLVVKIEEVNSRGERSVYFDTLDLSRRQ